MKKTLRLRALGFALIAVSIPATSASANTIGSLAVTDDPAGLHLNALMNGFRLYADASAHRFIAEDNMGVRAATRERWALLEERLLESTFVTLIYTYQANDGVPRARTYYAMSGRRVTRSGMRDPVLSADIDDYLDPWPGDVASVRLVQSASRVPWGMPEVRADSPWDMQDAEIKAIRSLEKDMNDGVVEQHGTATVFTSRPSCIACSQAMHNFANAYSVSVISKEVALSARGRPSRLQIAFLAKRVAYAATVRSSVHDWASLRPVDMPVRGGSTDDMCLVGMPVPALVGGFPERERSATKELLRAYAIKGLAPAYLSGSSDDSYTKWILAEPASPYSDLAPVQLSSPTPMDAMAQGFLSTGGHVLNQRGLHDMKARELGYTKVQQYVMPVRVIRGALSERMAGVREAYVRSARHTVGADHPAIAALYAVGLQLLRERADATSASAQRWLGIRVPIIEAVQANPTGWRPGGDDLHYLATLADSAMHDWVIAPPGESGERRPAVLFRIARMAAAYQDMQKGGPDPCGASALRVDRAAEESGRPRALCFNEATDRATYQWFARQLRYEMNVAGDEHLARMRAPLRHTIFGSDALGYAALENAYRKEIIDMHMANRLVAEGDMTPAMSLPVLRRAARIMQPEGIR